MSPALPRCCLHILRGIVGSEMGGHVYAKISWQWSLWDNPTFLKPGTNSSFEPLLTAGSHSPRHPSISVMVLLSVLFLAAAGRTWHAIWYHQWDLRVDEVRPIVDRTTGASMVEAETA